MHLLTELEALEEVEQEYGLACWKIDGCYVWKLLRWRLFTDHLIGHGVISFPHPKLLQSGRRKTRIEKKYKKIKLKCRKQLQNIRAKPTRQIVVYSNNRLVSFNGQKVDRSCVRFLSLDHDRVVFIENPPKNGPKPRPHERISSDVIIGDYKNPAPSSVAQLNEDDRNLIAVLQRTLSGTEVTEGRLLQAIQEFERRKFAFRSFLLKRNVKYAFVVCGHNKEPFIEACRELSVPVTEIQHGIIGRGHTGYDFKNWDKVPYFSDRFLAFGRSWPKTCHFPKNVKIEVAGDWWLMKKREVSLANIQRDPALLLVLSQATVSNLLREVVCEFLSVNTEYSVIWRPHPNEYPEEVEKFFRDSEFGHRLRLDSKTGLVEQACQSSVAIGVYTTALLEAIFCGCRGCVVEHEGGFHEFYRELIRDGKVNVVRRGRDLIEVVRAVGPTEIENYMSSKLVSDDPYFELQSQLSQ